jgi:hypothetical protein
MVLPKGYRHDEETRKKIAVSKQGDKNPKWQGGRITYLALYKWVRRNIPKTDLCQDCFQKPPRLLANITGIYDRQFDNWSWICLDCNRAYKNVIVLGNRNVM